MKAWSSHAILICDEGKEAAYTRLLRRMGVFNPIPSMLGGWPEGTATRNIPTEHILEDPVFKVSQRSYFIQLADFCAYSLLRKEQPVASKTKYGLDTAFDLLDAVLLREATRYDPQGVIRPPGRSRQENFLLWDSGHVFFAHAGPRGRSGATTYSASSSASRLSS